MSTSIGDWYRLSDAVLDDDRLKMRRASAEQLISRIAESQARPLEIVSLAVEVFGENFTAKPLLDEVIQCIEEHNPSADKAALSTALDPRILCAYAAEQALIGSPQNPAEQRQKLIAASAITSALRNRQEPIGTHAAVRMQAFLQTAESVLTAEDSSLRARTPISAQAISDLKEGDEAEDTLTRLCDLIQATVNSLVSNASKDREELQTLWWVIGEHSYKLQRPYAALNPGTAGIVAGVELSEITSSFASLGITALTAKILRVISGTDKKKSLSSLLEEVTPDAWRLIAPNATRHELASRNPEIFPLSRIALQHVGSGRTSGKTKTAIEEANVSAWGQDTHFTAKKLAAQVFAESKLLNLLSMT